MIYLHHIIWASILPHAVGLSMYETLRTISAQAEHIFDTFEYFWVDHKSKYFCNCLATRWRCNHFFPKRIHQKKFQLKIPIFSKSDDDATWWPNSYKKILTCGQLRNIQRYQKYVRHVRAFFLKLRTCSSQQCYTVLCKMYFAAWMFTKWEEK